MASPSLTSRAAASTDDKVLGRHLFCNQVRAADRPVFEQFVQRIEDAKIVRGHLSGGHGLNDGDQKQQQKHDCRSPPLHLTWPDSWMEQPSGVSLHA